MSWHRSDRTPATESAKPFGEALGSLYADKHRLEVVNVRIGSFQPRPQDGRALSTWLSPDDMVLLTIAALEARGVHCATVFGVSDNDRGWWDNRRAYALGYRPRDNAEAWAERVPEEIVEPFGRSVHGGFWADHGMGPDPEARGSGMPPTDPVPPATRVLITGAAGRIGKVLRQGLAGHYQRIRLSDIESVGEAGPGEEIVLADLTDPSIRGDKLRADIKHAASGHPPLQRDTEVLKTRQGYTKCLKTIPDLI